MRLIHWFRGREPIVLVGLLLITLGAWGFIELADEVIEGDTQSFDVRIVRAMREPGRPEDPIGPEWFSDMGRDITALGGVGVLVLFTVTVTLFFWLDGKRAAAIFLAAAIVSGMLCSFALKRAFQRPRPNVVPHLAYVATSSFPSGHAMMSAVVYLSLGAVLASQLRRRRLRIYVLSVAVVLTGLVGVSRVYMGVHYPTDVLAGWTAGLVWAIACWLVARWLQRRHHIERPGEHHLPPEEDDDAALSTG